MNVVSERTKTQMLVHFKQFNDTKPPVGSESLILEFLQIMSHSLEVTLLKLKIGSGFAIHINLSYSNTSESDVSKKTRKTGAITSVISDNLQFCIKMKNYQDFL